MAGVSNMAGRIKGTGTVEEVSGILIRQPREIRYLIIWVL
jgi:hypothetical protein